MYIHMNKGFYNILIEYSRSKLPNEACGFIVGTLMNSSLTAHTFLPVTNISNRPKESFVMDPIEVMNILSSKFHQAQMVGIFHTHPSSDANLSHHDLQTLWHTIPSHWVLSLQHPEDPILHIYKIRKTPKGVIKKDHPVSYHKLPFVID